MNSRTTARIVGILFIIATVAPLLSVLFVPAIFGPESIENVWVLAAVEYQPSLGALLEFIMAVAIAAIPIMMYPIIREYNERMALGFVVGRLVESIMFIIGTICLLTLVTLSKEYALSGIAESGYIQTSALMVLSIRSFESIFAQFAFSLGSIMFYYVLYKTRLIPRWLSGWALVGVLMFFASAFFPLFGYDTRSNIYLLLNAPGALGEMVFAVWLIVKGFNPPLQLGEK